MKKLVVALVAVVFLAHSFVWADQRRPAPMSVRAMGMAYNLVSDVDSASAVYLNPAMLPYLKNKHSFETGMGHRNKDISMTGDGAGDDTIKDESPIIGIGSHAYFATKINNDFSFGAGWNMPRNERIHFTDASPTAFTANFEEIEQTSHSSNFPISAGYRIINDKKNDISLAVGATLMPIYGTVTRQSLLSASTATEQSSGWGFGGNLGVQFNYSIMSLGMLYQSKSVEHQKGFASTTPANAQEALKFDVINQQTFSTGVTAHLPQNWNVTVSGTWRDFKQTRHTLREYPTSANQAATATTLDSAWVYGVGVEKDWAKTTLRFGVLYSDTIGGLADLGPTLMDLKYFRYAAGFAYKLSEKMQFNLAYNFVDADSRSTTTSAATSLGIYEYDLHEAAFGFTFSL